MACRTCCSSCSMPLLILFACFGAWNATQQSAYITPIGDLVATDGEPTIRIDCTGTYDPTKPTIIFLHGWVGNADNAIWVRQDPRLLATGLRFCSLDRPGYGYSENYFTEKHFGKVASITEAVLHSMGIKGDLILMFHSLGAYWALALASQIKLISKDPNIQFVGAVAVDGVSTEWKEWDVPMTSCSPYASKDSPSTLWSLVRAGAPSGLVRLGFLAGIGWFQDVIKMYPDYMQDTVFAYSMRRKYFDAIIIESQYWKINCGYAKAGEPIFAQLKAFEVIVVPNGLNLTQLALLNNRSNVTIASGPSGLEHSGILLHRDYAPICTDALLRVIHATR